MFSLFKKGSYGLERSINTSCSIDFLRINNMVFIQQRAIFSTVYSKLHEWVVVLFKVHVFYLLTNTAELTIVVLSTIKKVHPISCNK